MRFDFGTIVESYDLLNDGLSGGLHRHWKNRLVELLVRQIGERPHVVLDVAAGTGDVARRYRRRVPGVMVVGLDPSRPMLERAQRKRPRDTANEIAWVQAASEALPLHDGSVDAITCAFGVRNFDGLEQALREWHRVLRPAGVAAVLEIHPPPDAWYAPAVRLYWARVMPWIGAMLQRRAGYEYLRDSSLGFVTPPALAEIAARAGLQLAHRESLFAGGMVTAMLFLRDVS